MASLVPSGQGEWTLDEQSEGCLASLHAALLRAQDGAERLPDVLGSAFWTQVAAQEGESGALVSAAAKAARFTGECGFRGPARQLDRCQDDDFIACERPGVLPGRILALRKDGRIESLREDSPEYAKALQDTRD